MDPKWLCSLAQNVGDWLSQKQNEAHVLRHKENETPLANVDVEGDLKISRALKERFPGIPVLSEEGEVPDFSVREGWEQFWLVDPLDGTKEYLSGRSDYTVNIALIKNNVPIFGVVYAPGTKELYWTEGERAFKRDGQDVRQIFSRPQVSLGDEVTVLESRSHPSMEAETFLERFKIVQRIKLGSSLKICRLAEGLGSIYPRFGPTMEWDLAAADAVYRASGRNVMNFSPLRYNKPSLENPNFVLGFKASEVQPR